MTNQVGSVEVSVKANLNDLIPGLEQARAEVERFDRAAGRAAADGANKLTQASKENTKAAGAFATKLGELGDKASNLPGPLGAIGGRASGLAASLTSINITAAAASAGLGLLAIGLNRAIAEAADGETEFLRINAIIKATGQAAGFTAEQVLDMAGDIATATLAQEDAMVRAAGKLLTFRTVQRDTFREALELTQDLAAVGFGSVESAAAQLGRALEDPVNGITALRRAGVSFSAVQKQQIKDFVEAGQLAKAQGVVLAALKQQVGGAGRAEAGGLTGAYDRLNQVLSDFMENIGNSGPLQAWTAVINGMANAVDNLNRALFATDAEKLNDALAKRLDLQNRLAAAEKRGVFGAETAFNLRRQIDAVNEEIGALEGAEQARKKGEQAADAAATAVAEQAEKERLLGIELDKQKASAEAAAAAAAQLAEQRRQAVANLQSEIGVLQQVGVLYQDNSKSMQDIATQAEILQQLSQLQISATSAEGQAIAALIVQRNALTASIDAETQARQQAEAARAAFDKSMVDVGADIQSMQMRIDMMGLGAQEAETFRIRQELLNQAITAHGTLTQEQIQNIDNLAIAYGQAAGQLAEYDKMQKESEEQANRMAEQQMRLQESLASALTNAIFNADSAADAMANFAKSITMAIIEAQILKAIQSSGFLGGGGGGGGGNILGSLFSAGASLIGGGMTPALGPATMTGSSVGAFVQHQGGQHSDAPRRNVPSEVFIGAPRFHDGLRYNEYPAILEKGEEVIPKDQVGAGRSARQVNQTFIITTPDPNGFRASKRQIQREARQGMKND